VGERTNVIGSRKFKRLIAAGAWESAAEVGRAQVRKGAQIIDVCLADPDREELDDTEAFLSELIKKVKAPLMIDSTDAAVIERALTYCQGKSIINSVNLEDGEERFEEIVPLARKFGAALVVGCIDEDPIQGMAVTAARKLEVAQRSVDLLCGKYGLAVEDLIFDPLVFPCATGDAAYLGSAKETVEGVRAIKAAFPEARTILGISNVSFGLPPAGREVLNSVFLYECTRAGLDMAIINTEKLERYASIDPEELLLAEQVLFETSDATVAAFADHFRDASSRIVRDPSTLTLDERLANYIVEGSKEGLTADLDTKLKEALPLDIVNGPLMTGMDEVGRLFNDNQLIVAEVLQSAEAMKAAVDHLEPHMEQGAASTRGKIVLATVKGDVHDIGKNLVEIILGNNGYQVINLGIKVPPQDIIAAVRAHQPELLGLSGLLVKSAQMMVITAKDMSEAGVHPDMLVGGAALTRSFTHRKIAAVYSGEVLYAPDAMAGLALANRLVDDSKRDALLTEVAAEGAKLAIKADTPRTPLVRKKTEQAVTTLTTLPAPPDFDLHQLEDIPVDTVWRWINPRMLYGKHLGLKGDFDAKLAAGDATAVKIQEALEPLREEARAGRMKLRAQWRWFKASSDGDVLRVEPGEPGGSPVLWTLPRARGGGVGLPDYFAPLGPDGQSRDAVALFVVSAGEGIRTWAEDLKNAGLYLQSHAVQALALESAEALAEWLHSRLRGQWGFPDDPSATMLSRFKARYRGRRYSPGYPACPDLALQQGFWRLLEPEAIGVELTSGDMMDPEASVSALVIHHPEARYFTAEEDE
jgi:5-methyltetrahydrofolate--homocysteine methyltransferase